MRARIFIVLLLMLGLAPGKPTTSDKDKPKTEKAKAAVQETPSNRTAPKLAPAPVPSSSGPALPQWDEADLAALKSGKFIPGSLLLTNEMPPDEPEQKAEPMKVEAPTAEELAGNDQPSTEILDKFLSAYFSERPKTFLVDPQNLLTAQQYRDRLAFLNYHAADSSIDLFVYVFGESQEIPGEVRAEELAERLFSTGRPAAFVYYFLGSPQRSVFYLSPSLTDAVSGAEQRRALQSSVNKSLDKANMVEQLEAFSVQMSIRLYWLERILNGVTAPEGIHAVAEVPKHVEDTGAMAWMKKLPDRWWVPIAVLFGSVVAGLSMRFWLQYRARYRFPEFDVEPRMGGQHAAGVGAVISFASASLPPAVQREQVPDYLRRA